MIIKENIWMFLIPKADVAYLYEDMTIRQALEKMEYHKYNSIPIISKDGMYVGTLSEGDILRFIKSRSFLNFKEVEERFIKDVLRIRDYESVDDSCTIQILLNKISNQNFVPVIDSRGVFIGLVTRKMVLEHYVKKLLSE